MTRRDWNTFRALAGMLALNIVTALVSVLCCYSFRRQVQLHAVTSLRSCLASEKASVDASASALLLADIVRDSLPYDDDGAPVSVPVVLGFGQTRSKGAVYIYRDVQVDGVVHREFLERIPFSAISTFDSEAAKRP